MKILKTCITFNGGKYMKNASDISTLFLFVSFISIAGAAGLFTADIAAAGPVVSFKQNMEAKPGEQLVLPIELSGAAESGIGGFMLRLSYDTSIFRNPRVILEGTLCEGNPDVISGPARDYDPWTFSIGIGFSFSASLDGVLVKIQFDVSEDFKEKSTVSFMSPNQETYLNKDLMQTGFNLEIVPAQFVDAEINAAKPLSYERWDFNEDGSVDYADIVLFKSHWLTTCWDYDWEPLYDLVEDCEINVFDLAGLADNLN